MCCVLGDNLCHVLVIDMSTDFNPVIFFLVFRIVKSEMSHVAEKVRSVFLSAEVVIYLKDIPQL